MTAKKLWTSVFAAALATFIAAAHTQGNTRDEAYYFDAAENHYAWFAELGDNIVHGHPFKSFSDASINRWFGYNHEHPALMKTLFGLSWGFLHKCNHMVGQKKKHHSLGLLSDEAAMRLPSHILAALMATVIFCWAAELWSLLAGLLAAVLTVALPRLFFDSQLACFDAPIAAFWVFTVFAYWKALADRRWRPWAAVIFGLALATKHNAFFIPAVLGLHWLWMERGTIRARKFPRIPAAFFWMATLGPVVYFVSWPWLWHHTIPRFREYVQFHVHHVYYNMEYFGHNYNQPPFPLSFPYVMTALTIPVTTLVLALIGIALLLRKHKSDWRSDSRSTASLLLMNAVAPMAVLTVTRAPIFGATKHFHASLPFLALFAAFAFHYFIEKINLIPKWPRLVRVAAVFLFALPAVLETRRSHPYALTYYNALAGGPRGGATLGMNRQFWGYATTGLFPWINQHARRGAPIYWHDTNQSQLNMDVRTGILRADLRNTGLEEPGVQASDMALVIHEKHFNKYEYWIWDFYGTAQPSVVLDVEGVPVVTLYERPKVAQ